MLQIQQQGKGNIGTRERPCIEFMKLQRIQFLTIKEVKSPVHKP